MVVDTGKVEVPCPKLARQVAGPGLGQRLDDAFQGDSGETDSIVVVEGRGVDQLGGMKPKGGGDAAIEPRADGREMGLA